MSGGQVYLRSLDKLALSKDVKTSKDDGEYSNWYIVAEEGGCVPVLLLEDGRGGWS